MRIILLLFIGVIDLIFIINLFIPIFDDDGDLKNWATLLIEGCIFIPIAYYVSNLFFDKEKKNKEEEEKEKEKEKESLKIERIKKIFIKIHLANSNFYSLYVHNKKINISPSKIVSRSVSLYSGILNLYEKQIHEFYLVNPEYFPDVIATAIDNMHSLTENYREFDETNSNKGSLSQLWGNYLVLYGHFIAYKKLRDNFPKEGLSGHEENFKKYNKIYPADLTKMCGLDKYFN